MNKENNKISCHFRCCRPQASGMTNKKMNCHAELDSASSTHSVSQQQAWKIPNQVWNDALLNRGFTLLEILIAVIIIAVLAVIAVSAYQRAVVKSRFSSLMPTTRAIRDGQEDYYMRNGTYATAIADLDVKASNGSGMEIVPGDSTDTDLKYVFATRPTLNNNLLVYQKHSPKFADHIHCEALKGNSLAEWLCADALHGTKIEGSVSGDDYDTYVLEGEVGANDYFGKACEGSGEKSCDCGGPISGTCNTKTGEWSYGGECPEQPVSSQNCEGGKRQVRTVTCGSNGWETSAWSGCASEAAITAYNAIQEYDDLARAIRDAQEAYYKQYGKYAKTMNEMGFSMPENCKISTDSIGQQYSCGNNIFVDNSLVAYSTSASGFIMLEYCPGHNGSYTDCANNRSSISYYWYDHVNMSATNPKVPVVQGGESCLAMNNSSLGTETCSTYYEHYGKNW